MNLSKSITMVVACTALVSIAHAEPFTVAPLVDISDTGVQALAARFLDPNASLGSTPVLTGSAGQVGTFVNFASYAGSPQPGDFTLASGVILSTGDATAAADTYFGGPSTNEQGTGDSRLGNNTYDALSFLFAFTTSQSIFALNYAFASGEYPDSVGTQSDDIMAIYLNGVNIATVPGTNTSISVNTVNAGSNADYFLRYSELGVTPFAYGGITKLLSATGNLNTSGQNTLEIVIADGGDGIVDSAVLLQDGQGSPGPGPSPVPEPSTWALVGGAMVAYFLRRKLTRCLTTVGILLLSIFALSPIHAQTNQQALMVPVQTRIITGSGFLSSDYAIRVGNNLYSLPNDGNAYGLQVLFLNRQTLEKVDIRHVMGDKDLSPLNNGPYCGALGCLVIIQSLQNIGPVTSATNPCGNGVDCPLSLALATEYGAPQDPLYSVDTYNIDTNYSLISTVIGGNPGQGYQRLTCKGQQGICGPSVPQAGGNGAIQGVLILDNLGGYTFAYPGRATFSTGAGSSKYRNIMTIGPNYGAPTTRGVYRSDNVPDGSGAFHIVVLYRDSLGLFSNNTYITNSNDQFQGAINTLYRVAGDGNLVVMIASIGNMTHNADDFIWLNFGLALEKVGGSYDVLRQVQNTDSYSLVGWGGANVGTGAVEASSAIQRAINGPPVPANIRGVLKQGVNGNYGPAYSNLTSGFTQSTIAMLDAVALQPATPFPPFNVGQLNAYGDLSLQISTTADVRSLYTDPDQDPNKWLILVKAAPYSATPRYTQAQFEYVRNQLAQEFSSLISIYTFRNNLKIFFNTLTLEESGILDQVYNAVQNGLQPPAATTGFSGAWQMIFGVASNVVGTVLSAYQPELYIAYDMAFIGIQTAMEYSKTASGQAVNNSNTRFDQLKEQARQNFASSQATLNRLFDLITSDWGRMQRLGIPLANGKIDFGTDVQRNAITSMEIALRRQYFTELIGSMFVRAVWNNTDQGASTDATPYGACDSLGIPSGDCQLANLGDPSNLLVVFTPQHPPGGRGTWQVWSIGQSDKDARCGPKNPTIFGPMFSPLTQGDTTKLGIYKPHYMAYQGPPKKSVGPNPSKGCPGN